VLVVPRAARAAAADERQQAGARRLLATTPLPLQLRRLQQQPRRPMPRRRTLRQVAPREPVVPVVGAGAAAAVVAETRHQ
jgi:hypothetical protein